MKLKSIILIVFLFSPLTALGGETNQIIWFGGNIGGEEPIDANKIALCYKNLEGTYRFGTSQMESHILITKANNSYSLKHKAGRFTEDGTQFKWKYEEVNNFAIKEGQFKKGKWRGRFVYYYFQPIDQEYKDGRTIDKVNPTFRFKGLIIYDSTVGIKNELGFMPTFHETCKVAGDYPVTHYRLLNHDDIKGKSKHELKLMRNEIFARYGYIFNPGGRMDNHFRSKIWYTPKFKDVTAFINKKEMANIEFLLSNE